MLSIVLILGGCASTPKQGQLVADPLENINRKIFNFNQAADKHVLKPIAIGYASVVPDPIETAIVNFFRNVEDLTSIVNNLLQGRPQRAASDVSRVLVNSTVGILGFIDVATATGIPRYAETFGQTFGVWGIGEGPYLVLPFFGPANGRTLAGRITQGATTDITAFIDDNPTRWGVSAVNFISFRAQLLGVGNLLDQAAFDPYLFWRDAFVS